MNEADRQLSRRVFLQSAAGLILPPFIRLRSGRAAEFAEGWANPGRDYSPAPFWFWNDELTEAEICRQMQDFCDHGVYAFVIHPRVGLPRSLGWMSDGLLRFMRFAVEEAQARGMWVILYDEGMYPSGSASGQVAAENPAFRPHGLFAADLDASSAKKNSFSDGDLQIVAVVRRKTNGHRIAIIDRIIRPGFSLIRGLHYLEDDPAPRADGREPAEEMPPLADILNPQAVDCFIRLVYQRYYDKLGDHFGKTIRAVFTDEPSFLGKNPEPGAVPGNAEAFAFVRNLLGDDFCNRSAALWYDDEPDAPEIRRHYFRALKQRLDVTYYRPLSQWCREHGIALTGHPADPDDMGHLRWFHIPGQDIVWRMIEPGKPSALEGQQSTQAKAASSVMIHMRRRRNANEFCGAYGRQLTFEEVQWLARWLLIRGCNLLIPHAFYYSIRGPRIDERPPDVGPNSPWWSRFKPFADEMRRLCRLNSEFIHVCRVAVLGLSDYLPWQAAKVCFQHQIDFNYVEARHLWEDAVVDADGLHLADMHYGILIVEFEPPKEAREAVETLHQAGRVIYWRPEIGAPLHAEECVGREILLTRLREIIPVDVRISPANRDLRVRHLQRAGQHVYLLFNEGEPECEIKAEFSVDGRQYECLPDGSLVRRSRREPLRFAAHQFKVILILH